MKSNPGQTEPTVSERKRKSAKRAGSDGDFKLHIRRPCTVDTDGPWGDADTKTGKKTNQRLKTQKPHSHQWDFLFRMQCRPRAERKNRVSVEGAWKIQCNYWVGEKAVRLKDEGPALRLQRDLTLPWAHFQSCCREKKKPTVSHY